MAVEALKQLPLSELTEDWVKSVWESDFIEVQLEEGLCLDNAEILACLQTLIVHIDKETSAVGEKDLLTNIKDNGVSVNAVIALLANLISTANKRTSDVTDKEAGIVAAGVYVRLILLPGSSAFHLFHSEPFEKCLDLLKQIISLSNTGKRKRITPQKRTKQKRPPKARRPIRSQSQLFDDDVEDNGEEGEVNRSGLEELELVPQDVNRLQKQLHKLCQVIIKLMELFSLRQAVLSARHAVDIFTSLTRLEINSGENLFNTDQSLSRMSVPALAYKGLLLLCTQLHGNMVQLMNLTLKNLLPSLLMLVDNHAVQTVTKPLSVIRDHTLEFVLILLNQCGDRGQTCCRTLLQHLCTKVPDKADYRSKVIPMVIQISLELSADNYSRMVQWYYKLSKHATISYRGFAVEILAALLSAPTKHTAADIPPELKQYVSQRFLLTTLLDRCSDASSSVRARAIVCFSQCLTTKNQSVAQSMKDIVTPLNTAGPDEPFLIKTPAAQTDVASPVVQSGSSVAAAAAAASMSSTICNTILTEQASSSVPPYSADKQRPGTTPLHHVHLTPATNTSLADKDGVFSLLRRRANDDKVLVRKAALQALENAIRFELPNLRKENVEVLRDHCRDPGLTARKQAMQSLTDLLQENPTFSLLQSIWLAAVLPLVLDRENSLQEKSMNTLEEMILHNIKGHRGNRPLDEESNLAWSLLNIMATQSNVDYRSYFQKACYHWSRHGKIKPALISALESHVGTERNSASWMLLALLTPAVKKMDHTFILNYWRNRSDTDCGAENMERVLTVIRYAAKHFPTNDRTSLIADIEEMLMRFDSQPEIVSVSIRTIEKLSSIQAEESGNVTLKTAWCKDLISACDCYLSAVVLEENSSQINEDKILLHLLTLSEVIQVCPSLTSRHIFLLVQSLITRPTIPSVTRATTGSQGDQERSNSTSTSDKIDTSTGSQGSQASCGTQGTQGTQPLSQFAASNMSNRVRASAFIALGKLCLQDENLAKKCVAALAFELETATHPAIRNNVVVVLCDLCVRYTTVANHYIGDISMCLKDKVSLVRKQTLTLITRLIQEDFLKWKGVLFYRFMSTLLDECSEIRSFAEICLIHMLIRRFPNMFFQHFVECIFFYNDYRDHSAYNRFTQTDRDRLLFSLKGEENSGKRLQLYKFLLENMTDHQRFQVQDKLCQEILGGIVDGVLPLNDATTALVKDALAILVCKEIKLTTLKVAREEEATDEQEVVAVVVAAARKNIITQVVKKTVIEMIVPVVMGLKHKFEQERSALMKDLMIYLQELMKDYKKEVKEVLSADRQLATEIEFDLRRFEEQERAAQQQTQVLDVQSDQGQTNNLTPASPQPLLTPAPEGQPGSPQVRGQPGSPQVRVQPGSPQVRGQPGSPQIRGITSPRAVNLSRTPRLRVSEGRITTPNVNLSPALQREATYNRETGLGLCTYAMLNAACKVGPGPPAADTDAQSNISPKNTPVKVTSDQADGNTKENEAEETPNQRHRRAISTPAVVLQNITFHMDPDATFLPPSPIQEDEDAECRYEEEDDADTFVPPPWYRPPGTEPLQPKMWNVTSPHPNKGRQGKRTPAPPIMRIEETEDINNTVDSSPKTRRTGRRKNKR